MVKATGNGKAGRQSKKTEKPKGTLSEKGQIEITIVPNHSSSFPSFYANYASVSHTATEMFLDFCLLGLPYSVDLEQKAATVPVVARIIIPPQMAEGLIKALQAQMEKQKRVAEKGGLFIPIPVKAESGKS